MTKLTDEDINKLSNLLSGLSLSQWNEIKNGIDKLYHPVKKALTSEEINALLLNIKGWI
ncbi:hypothetical protein ACNAN0_03750 [Agrilactobacillus fermenti]|uniref:hypothetical protein n=1 Tax=Agrilactobacillus fermenti TaxID=2586909 RepID=UPI003A5BE8F0